jgi:cohesin loading factor subunit SCC2
VSGWKLIRQDSGLAVRKKVIKLLKEIFPMTETNAIRVDICCKMVELIGDADDNIKVCSTKSQTSGEGRDTVLMNRKWPSQA